MENETTVVDATVAEKVENLVVLTCDTIKAQQAAFQGQLDQVKKGMTEHQQAFENLKIRGIKLEGALESLDLLLKSLSK